MINGEIQIREFQVRESVELLTEICDWDLDEIKGTIREVACLLEDFEVDRNTEFIIRETASMLYHTSPDEISALLDRLEPAGGMKLRYKATT